MLHYTSHYAGQFRFRRAPARTQHFAPHTDAVRSALGESHSEDPGFGHSGPANGQPVQTKLSVGAPNDSYEQEADRVANAVVANDQSVSTASISPVVGHPAQRACSECEDEVQRKALGGPESASTSGAVGQVSAMGTAGRLPQSSRRFFESRLNTDFSQVHVHTDQRARQSAESLNARAYTLGNHIVFNQGQYDPHSREGRRLLAHELTHVVQQRKGLSGRVQRSCSDGNCDDCAGGWRTLWMTFFFARRANRVTMAVLRRRIDAAKRILRNCCIHIKFAFNWTLIPNASTLSPAARRPDADANGLFNVPNDIETIGEGDLIAGSRGIPLLVVDEVRRSGGAAAILGGQDDQGRDFDLEYTGPSMFYMAVNQPNEGLCSQRDSTIVHELWHLTGALRHDAAEAGGIADCSSDAVNDTYCNAVRGLT